MMGHKNIGVSVLCPGLTKTKIMDCERNRPDELKKQTVAVATNAQEVEQFLVQGVAGGMPVEQLVDIVFEAIKENKFYIMPNAEQFKPGLKIRMDGILQERNPTNPFAQQ